MMIEFTSTQELPQHQPDWQAGDRRNWSSLERDHVRTHGASICSGESRELDIATLRPERRPNNFFD